MKPDKIRGDENYAEDSPNHRTYIELDQPWGGKKIVSLDVLKDRSQRTHDPERYIKRLRLPSRPFDIVTEAGLLVTGSTFVTSIFGKFLLNKAMEDWRVGLLLAFVLLVFPFFLYLYTSSKVADVKWAFGLKLLSVSFGAVIGGSYA